MADVILPDLGESVTEGIIIRWMKGVGDTVERDEPLYEVSTGKVDSEVPSPVAGVLVEIVVPEGDTVAVGGTVAVIGDAGQVAAAAPAPSTSAQEAPAAEAASGSPARSTQAPQHAGQGSGQVTSPFVRRAIEQRGLEAGSIHGSGPGGRITRLDVANATVTRPLVALGSIDRGSPTGFVALEATFDAVDAVLAEHPALLSRTSFVVHAAVEALQAFPELNGTITGAAFEVVTDRHVGVEVELAGGLIIPVLRNCEELNVTQIATGLDAVIARAEADQLDPFDLIGATFSVAASAAANILLTVPALAGPQVASLGIGAVTRRPVVVEEGDGTESVGIRSIGVLGLSFDLRIVEPSRAASFLSATAAILAGSQWSARL